MLKFGTNNIGKVLFGSNVIGRAYYGSNLVYSSAAPPPPPPPPYDAQVEWIATDGNQYINLGIRGNAATDALYVDFQPSQAINQARLIGANQSNSPCQIYVNGSNSFGFRLGSSWGNINDAGAVGTDRHTWFCDYFNLKNTIDGTDYAMASESTGVTNSNLLLTGPYAGNNIYKGKIYAAKIYRNGTLILDLIPVRVDTTAYMYDNISGELFGNAGTGAYTYGNDITE